MARDQAPDPRCHDECFQYDRAGDVVERLVEEREHGDEGGGVE